MRVTRRGRGAIAMAAIGMVVCAALPSTAAAETVEHQASQTVPIATTTENPCTGEPVSLTGTYHFNSQYRVTADESGVRFHSIENNKLSLSGTALVSGARYQNEEHYLTEFNGQFSLEADALGPFERTDVTTMLLIRQGDTPRLDDFFVRITSHITFNANGVVTVSGGDVNVFCR